MAFVTCTTFFKKINELKEKFKEMAEGKQAQLKNCNGENLAANTQIPDCASMNTAIEEKFNQATEEAAESAATVFNEKIRVFVENTNWSITTEDGKNLRLRLPACRAKVETVTAPYTIQADDEVVVVSNGGAITLPSLDVGREVMIIQGSAAAVSINGASGVNVIAPLGGNLTLAGQNATVSVLATADGVVRVFGQTAEV